MAICEHCFREMRKATSCIELLVEFPDGTTLDPVPYEGENRCPDCNVKPGGFHHPGCDNEKCPKCGGQLISCGCLDEEEEY